MGATRARAVVAALGLLAALGGGTGASAQTTPSSGGHEAAKAAGTALAEALRPPLPASIVVQVKRGEFRRALTSLDALGDVDREKYTGESERLGHAAALFDLADEAARQRRRSEVTALLSELSKLELPTAELALKEGVARAEQRLLESLRSSQAPSDRAALMHAKSLLANGDLDGAASVYEGISRDRDQHLAELAYEAERGIEAVRRQKTPWQKYLASGLSSVSTLVQWILGLAVAWLVHGGVRRWLEQHPLQEPGLEITVTGLPAASGAATAQVADQLRGDTGQELSPTIDATEDVDRSGLANINLSTEDLDLPKELASSTERISFLGLSFTPQQIYALLRLRRPRVREFIGTLSSNDGTHRLVLRERECDRRDVSWFTCEATTSAEALAETADYIAFRTACWRITDSWPSFRAYRRALRSTRKPGREGSTEWPAARELLIRALAEDPHNIVARYQLGVMLRRTGRNDDAATQLARVNAALADIRSSDSLRKFVERNPQFLSTVRYDLALCHAKQDSFKDLEAAEKLLLDLELQSGARGARPNRFGILASGSLAAVTAGRMGLELAALPRNKREDWRPGRGKELFDKIVARASQLEALRSDPAQVDAAACSSAWAIAMAAQGRALILLNDRQKAERALREARAENPNLACASIHLADVLEASNEDEEALILLQQALELSPRNARAFHLLGLIHQKRGDDETAVMFLEKARVARKSAAVDILYATSLRNLHRDVEALRALAHSIRTTKRHKVDYRYQQFLDIANHQDKLSALHVELAERYLGQIERQPEAVNVERCREYMIEIKRRWPNAQPPPAAARPTPRTHRDTGPPSSPPPSAGPLLQDPQAFPRIEGSLEISKPGRDRDRP